MIIDSDQNGLIDVDEFVTGCQNLHGPAKSIQIARMSHENKVRRENCWATLGSHSVDVGNGKRRMVMEARFSCFDFRLSMAQDYMRSCKGCLTVLIKNTLTS